MTHRRRHPQRRVARRGFALLLTLMVLTVLIVIVAHVTARVGVAIARNSSYVLERQCRRALDSAVGFAVRGLTEDIAALRIDHLGEQWCRPKVYRVGEVQVEIRIEDCARRYDLKGLLEEDKELRDDSIAEFVEFAVYCGLSATVAQELADAIAAEALARREEDEVEQEPVDAVDAEGGESVDAAAAVSEVGAVPNWLEDYLSLPSLSDEQRNEILAAQATYTDPVTFEEVTFRLTDLLTIWRYDKVNINTASRPVLLFSIPGMVDREDDLDELLIQRREEPFSNLASVQSEGGLDRDQIIQVTKTCGLTSRRFRVTATATFVDRKLPPGMRPGKMTLIIERTGNNEFKTLWRHASL